ncbi:hypothetical protein KDL01_29440 [Actinospica durhamensis]|uniref:Condensation domain-containing protein n=1 Tax=Actinospica durhamensis TaxID=1508375 RepID=A0A941EZV2_9ACTN|nr:hypothetical protein [Actinospica durhamensis]MBR7837439.1 hypothetical protein [Actinospica durhamensis]
MHTEACSAVDEIHLLSERPEEPNLHYVEAALAGKLELPRLRAAVAAVLEAEPAARSRIATTSPLRLWTQWAVPDAAETDPVVERTVAGRGELADAREEIFAATLPMRTGPLFRLHVLTQGRITNLILVAHHARFDGYAALGLMQAIASAYSGGPPHAPATVGREDAKGAARPPRYQGPPMRIEPGRTAQDRDAPTSGYRFRHVAMDLRDLTNAASYYAEATVEDALLAEIARAVYEWNASLGKAWGQVRVTVPSDRRASEEKYLALGNRTGYGTVVLDLAEVAGNPLASVAAQTKHLRREAAEADPLARAFAEPWAPFGVRRALKRPADRRTASRVDTTMLAHLGTASTLWFGAVRTGALWYAPPAPLPMGLAVGAVRYGNRMHLTLRYRRSLFTTPPFWGRG